jgi:hypothetical protein
MALVSGIDNIPLYSPAAASLLTHIVSPAEEANHGAQGATPLCPPRRGRKQIPELGDLSAEARRVKAEAKSPWNLQERGGGHCRG